VGDCAHVVGDCAHDVGAIAESMFEGSTSRNREKPASNVVSEACGAGRQ